MLVVLNSIQYTPAEVVALGAKMNYKNLSPPFTVKVVGKNEKAVVVVVKVKSSINAAAAVPSAY